MSRRRQDVLRIYPSRRNPFHQKVCARVAALQGELGMSESEAAMHLLLHQVLDEAEKKIAGLVPHIQPAATCDAPAASKSDRIQSGSVSSPDQAPHRGTGTATISESVVDQIPSASDTDVTVQIQINNQTDSVAQSAEDSLSRRTKWRSLGRTSKSASND